jgi:hypothetical protein
MPNLVITQAPVATIDAIKTAISAQITAFTPFKVGLNDDEKTGARSMAADREGYARMISQIATANINSLARDQNPTDLASKLAYDSKLEELRQGAMSYLEMIEETQLANSVDIMRLTDGFVRNLQAARVNNSSLDNAMREVDEYNKRFGARPNAKPEVPAL